MSPWSWNNRGRSSERGWARFHGRPAETNPLPPPPQAGTLRMRKIWITFGTHFAFEIGLSEADRPYQEHRGAVAPQIPPDPYQPALPHPSIYALHKFYWHAVIEINLIVNWSAFLSQRRTRGLGQYLRDGATDRDSWIPNRPWMGFICATLIIPDSGNTLIYSIWRYRINSAVEELKQCFLKLHYVPPLTLGATDNKKERNDTKSNTGRDFWTLFLCFCFFFLSMRTCQTWKRGCLCCKHMWAKEAAVKSCASVSLSVAGWGH